MGHLDTILHFAGPGLAVTLVSIGIGMARDKDFFVARVLFWIATVIYSVYARTRKTEALNFSISAALSDSDFRVLA